MKRNNVGTYSEAIEHIRIVENDDMEQESSRYKDAFQYFDKAKIEFSKLHLFPKEEVTFEKFLPLMIKESRLLPTARSKHGAIGYFQLKDIAIKEVNLLLQRNKIDTKSYFPKTNPTHNSMYWIIYFLHTIQSVQEQCPDIQDADNLVYASYNAGISTIVTLLKTSESKSRNDLVYYVVHNKMWLSGQSHEIDWPYGPKMKDFFGGKDYSKNDKTIFQKGGTTLTMAKAQEFIKYVETINSLSIAINQWRWWLKYYAMVPIIKWTTLFSTIKDMKMNNKLKIKDGINLIDFCKDIALDNNKNPDHIVPWDTLVITRDMMKGFDYLDENIYAYDVVKYDKTAKYFLGKIVKDKVKEKSFQENIMQKVPQLTSLEDNWDKEFYIMNSLIDFNTKNRKWWTVTTSKDVRIPLDAKYYTDFFAQSEREVEKIDDNSVVDIKNNYINPSFESLWNELVYQWNFKERDMLNIERSFNCVTSKRQSKQKEKLTHPDYIILHSTGGNIGDIPWIKAHFFVSKNWIINKLTDDEGNFRKLNHAGVWMTGCGAIWDWDKEITYESIGIEVEALGGERWNAKEYEAVKKLISYLGWKYKIHKKDVLTHSQVAFSSVWRGRKQDPYYVDWRKLWNMPDNYMRIDKDVAQGKSPNMTQFVKQLKDKWMTNAEIRDYLSGIDAGIAIANTRKVKKMNKQDSRARSPSSTILRNY